MATASTPVTQGDLSLIDLNFFLVNKLIVLLAVVLFFVVITIVSRIRSKPTPPMASTAIKLSMLGLILLYFEATLTGYPNYRMILTRIQSVIVLICLAKLVIYILVDLVLSLRRHGDVPMLLRDAIRLAVYMLAGIASLRLVFQVDLSAIITTTTVLTAAVAFAMQTTLSNAFYGFTVQIDPLMARGNWISIPEKDLLGEIVNVGFRYITLRNIDNNLILVPNTVVVQSVVTTHGSYREAAHERACLTLLISLPYELPPEQARTILYNVIREEPLVLKQPEPVVRLKEMAESSINYNLIFWIENPSDRNLAVSELQIKIWYAVYRAGWSFPFPHRQLVTTEMRPSFPQQKQSVRDGLRHSDLFDLLSEEELVYLAESASLKPFAPGEIAVKQGDSGSSLFLILQGELVVEIDGNQVATLGKGKMFGEMSLLTGEPRMATVKAISEAILAELPKTAIAVLFDNNERLFCMLSEAMARHTRNNLNQVDTRVEIGSAECSPAEYLKRLRDFFAKG